MSFSCKSQDCLGGSTVKGSILLTEQQGDGTWCSVGVVYMQCVREKQRGVDANWCRQIVPWLALVDTSQRLCWWKTARLWEGISFHTGGSTASCQGNKTRICLSWLCSLLNYFWNPLPCCHHKEHSLFKESNTLTLLENYFEVYLSRNNLWNQGLIFQFVQLIIRHMYI